MNPVADLGALLAHMQPTLQDGCYVFVTLPGARYGDGVDQEPLAAFFEDEGLTLVVPRSRADAHGQPYSDVFRRITLAVYSALSAVGLTAAVAGALAARGIPANVVAAYHHDHVFVPADRAEEAMDALMALAAEAQR